MEIVTLIFVIALVGIFVFLFVFSILVELFKAAPETKEEITGKIKRKR